MLTNDAAVKVSSKAHLNFNFTVVNTLRAKNTKANAAIMRITSRYRSILFVGWIPHTAADILIKSKVCRTVHFAVKQSPIASANCLSPQIALWFFPAKAGWLNIVIKQSACVPSASFDRGLRPRVTNGTLRCICKYRSKTLRSSTSCQHRQKDETLHKRHLEYRQFSMSKSKKKRKEEGQDKRGAWNGLITIQAETLLVLYPVMAASEFITADRSQKAKLTFFS